MRRSNRVEPSTTDLNGTGDLTRATVTTTTRMEFVRRVQVVPMREALAQLNTDLNQSLGGDVIISPRLWTGMNRLVTPATAQRSSRTIWFAGCIFIFVGLLALVATIAGLTLAFRGGSSTIGESNIEKYEVGDLHYGLSNMDQTLFPSDSYLSSDNQASVQQYLANQLSSESGFRGLFIDSVLVQDQSGSSGRRRRQVSCSTRLIIRNIRIFFDYCSTCTGSRNLALRRALGNLTTFQSSLILSVNNGTASNVSTQICSTPNITRLIVPIRLSILQAQEINSTLIYNNVSITATTEQTTYSSTTTSTRSSARTSYGFTSKAITSQRRITSPRITTVRTTTTTTMATEATTILIETTPFLITTMTTMPLQDSPTSTALPMIETSTIEFIPTSSILPTELTTIAETLVTSTSQIDQTTSVTDSISTDVTTLETDATSTVSLDLTSEQASTVSITDTMSTPFNLFSTSDYFTTDGSEITTSTQSTHRPTTMRIYTTQSATTKRGKGTTYNPRRITSIQTIPFIPILPSQSTRLPRNISFSTVGRPVTSITSTRPDRTRKQTGYSTASLSRTTQRSGVSIPLTLLSTFQPKTPMTSAISTGRTRKQTGFTTGSDRFTMPVTTGRTRRQTAQSTGKYDTTMSSSTTAGRTRKQTGLTTAKSPVSVPMTLLSTFQPKVPMTSAITTRRARPQTVYTTGSYRYTTPRLSVSVPVSTGRTRKQTGLTTAKFGVSVPVTLMSTYRRDFTSIKPTTYRTDTTATQRRGRFRSTWMTVKQTTPIVTTMRPTTTAKPIATSTSQIDTSTEVQPSTIVTETSIATSSPFALTSEQNYNEQSTVVVPTTSETSENVTPPVSTIRMHSMASSLSDTHESSESSFGSTPTSSMSTINELSSIEDEQIMSTKLLNTLFQSSISTYHSQPTSVTTSSPLTIIRAIQTTSFSLSRISTETTEQTSNNDPYPTSTVTLSIESSQKSSSSLTFTTETSSYYSSLRTLSSSEYSTLIPSTNTVSSSIETESTTSLTTMQSVHSTANNSDFDDLEESTNSNTLSSSDTSESESTVSSTVASSHIFSSIVISSSTVSINAITTTTALTSQASTDKTNVKLFTTNSNDVMESSIASSASYEASLSSSNDDQSLSTSVDSIKSTDENTNNIDISSANPATTDSIVSTLSTTSILISSNNHDHSTKETISDRSSQQPSTETLSIDISTTSKMNSNSAKSTQVTSQTDTTTKVEHYSSSNEVVNPSSTTMSYSIGSSTEKRNPSTQTNSQRTSYATIDLSTQNLNSVDHTTQTKSITDTIESTATRTLSTSLSSTDQTLAISTESTTDSNGEKSTQTEIFTGSPTSSTSTALNIPLTITPIDSTLSARTSFTMSTFTETSPAASIRSTLSTPLSDISNDYSAYSTRTTVGSDPDLSTLSIVDSSSSSALRNDMSTESISRSSVRPILSTESDIQFTTGETSTMLMTPILSTDSSASMTNSNSQESTQTKTSHHSSLLDQWTSDALTTVSSDSGTMSSIVDYSISNSNNLITSTSLTQQSAFTDNEKIHTSPPAWIVTSQTVDSSQHQSQYPTSTASTSDIILTTSPIIDKITSQSLDDASTDESTSVAKLSSRQSTETNIPMSTSQTILSPDVSTIVRISTQEITTDELSTIQTSYANQNFDQSDRSTMAQKTSTVGMTVVISPNSPSSRAAYAEHQSTSFPHQLISSTNDVSSSGITSLAAITTDNSDQSISSSTERLISTSSIIDVTSPIISTVSKSAEISTDETTSFTGFFNQESTQSLTTEYSSIESATSSIDVRRSSTQDVTSDELSTTVSTSTLNSMNEQSSSMGSSVVLMSSTERGISASQTVNIISSISTTATESSTVVASSTLTLYQTNDTLTSKIALESGSTDIDSKTSTSQSVVSGYTSTETWKAAASSSQETNSVVFSTTEISSVGPIEFISTNDQQQSPSGANKQWTSTIDNSGDDDFSTSTSGQGSAAAAIVDSTVFSSAQSSTTEILSTTIEYSPNETFTSSISLQSESAGNSMQTSTNPSISTSESRITDLITSSIDEDTSSKIWKTESTPMNVQTTDHITIVTSKPTSFTSKNRDSTRYSTLTMMPSSISDSMTSISSSQQEDSRTTLPTTNQNLASSSSLNSAHHSTIINFNDDQSSSNGLSTSTEGQILTSQIVDSTVTVSTAGTVPSISRDVITYENTLITELSSRKSPDSSTAEVSSTNSVYSLGATSTSPIQVLDDSTQTTITSTKNNIHTTNHVTFNSSLQTATQSSVATASTSTYPTFGLQHSSVQSSFHDSQSTSPSTSTFDKETLSTGFPTNFVSSSSINPTNPRTASSDRLLSSTIDVSDSNQERTSTIDTSNQFLSTAERQASTTLSSEVSSSASSRQILSDSSQSPDAILLTTVRTQLSTATRLSSKSEELSTHQNTLDMQVTSEKLTELKTNEASSIGQTTGASTNVMSTRSLTPVQNMASTRQFISSTNDVETSDGSSQSFSDSSTMITTAITHSSIGSMRNSEQGISASQTFHSTTGTSSNAFQSSEVDMLSTNRSELSTSSQISSTSRDASSQEPSQSSITKDSSYGTPTENDIQTTTMQIILTTASTNNNFMSSATARDTSTEISRTLSTTISIQTTSQVMLTSPIQAETQSATALRSSDITSSTPTKIESSKSFSSTSNMNDKVSTTTTTEISSAEQLMSISTSSTSSTIMSSEDESTTFPSHSIRSDTTSESPLHSTGMITTSITDSNGGKTSTTDVNDRLESTIDQQLSTSQMFDVTPETSSTNFQSSINETLTSTISTSSIPTNAYISTDTSRIVSTTDINIQTTNAVTSISSLLDETQSSAASTSNGTTDPNNEYTQHSTPVTIRSSISNGVPLATKAVSTFTSTVFESHGSSFQSSTLSTLTPTTNPEVLSTAEITSAGQMIHGSTEPMSSIDVHPENESTTFSDHSIWSEDITESSLHSLNTMTTSDSDELKISTDRPTLASQSSTPLEFSTVHSSLSTQPMITKTSSNEPPTATISLGSIPTDPNISTGTTRTVPTTDIDMKTTNAATSSSSLQDANQTSTTSRLSPSISSNDDQTQYTTPTTIQSSTDNFVSFPTVQKSTLTSTILDLAESTRESTIFLSSSNATNHDKFSTVETSQTGQKIGISTNPMSTNTEYPENESTMGTNDEFKTTTEQQLFTSSTTDATSTTSVSQNSATSSQSSKENQSSSVVTEIFSTSLGSGSTDDNVTTSTSRTISTAEKNVQITNLVTPSSSLATESNDSMTSKNYETQYSTPTTILSSTDDSVPTGIVNASTLISSLFSTPESTTEFSILSTSETESNDQVSSTTETSPADTNMDASTNSLTSTAIYPEHQSTTSMRQSISSTDSSQSVSETSAMTITSIDYSNQELTNSTTANVASKTSTDDQIFTFQTVNSVATEAKTTTTGTMPLNDGSSAVYMSTDQITIQTTTLLGSSTKLLGEMQSSAISSSNGITNPSNEDTQTIRSSISEFLSRSTEEASTLTSPRLDLHDSSIRTNTDGSRSFVTSTIAHRDHETTTVAHQSTWSDDTSQSASDSLPMMTTSKSDSKQELTSRTTNSVGLESSITDKTSTSENVDSTFHATIKTGSVLSSSETSEPIELSTIRSSLATASTITLNSRDQSTDERTLVTEFSSRKSTQSISTEPSSPTLRFSSTVADIQTGTSGSVSTSKMDVQPTNLVSSSLGSKTIGVTSENNDNTQYASLTTIRSSISDSVHLTTETASTWASSSLSHQDSTNEPSTLLSTRQMVISEALSTTQISSSDQKISSSTQPMFSIPVGHEDESTILPQQSMRSDEISQSVSDSLPMITTSIDDLYQETTTKTGVSDEPRISTEQQSSTFRLVDVTSTTSVSGSSVNSSQSSQPIVLSTIRSHLSTQPMATEVSLNDTPTSTIASIQTSDHDISTLHAQTVNHGILSTTQMSPAVLNIDASTSSLSTGVLNPENESTTLPYESISAHGHSSSVSDSLPTITSSRSDLNDEIDSTISTDYGPKSSTDRQISSFSGIDSRSSITPLTPAIITTLSQSSTTSTSTSTSRHASTAERTLVTEPISIEASSSLNLQYSSNDIPTSTSAFHSSSIDPHINIQTTNIITSSSSLPDQTDSSLAIESNGIITSKTYDIQYSTAKIIRTSMDDSTPIATTADLYDSTMESSTLSSFKQNVNGEVLSTTEPSPSWPNMDASRNSVSSTVVHFSDESTMSTNDGFRTTTEQQLSTSPTTDATSTTSLSQNSATSSQSSKENQSSSVVTEIFSTSLGSGRTDDNVTTSTSRTISTAEKNVQITNLVTPSSSVATESNDSMTSKNYETQYSRPTTIGSSIDHSALPTIAEALTSTPTTTDMYDITIQSSSRQRMESEVVSTTDTNQLGQTMSDSTNIVSGTSADLKDETLSSSSHSIKYKDISESSSVSLGTVTSSISDSTSTTTVTITSVTELASRKSTQPITIESPSSAILSTGHINKQTTNIVTSSSSLRDEIQSSSTSDSNGITSRINGETQQSTPSAIPSRIHDILTLTTEQAPALTSTISDVDGNTIQSTRLSSLGQKINSEVLSTIAISASSRSSTMDSSSGLSSTTEGQRFTSESAVELTTSSDALESTLVWADRQSTAGKTSEGSTVDFSSTSETSTQLAGLTISSSDDELTGGVSTNMGSVEADISLLESTEWNTDHSQFSTLTSSSTTTNVLISSNQEVINGLPSAFQTTSTNNDGLQRSSELLTLLTSGPDVKSESTSDILLSSFTQSKTSSSVSISTETFEIVTSTIKTTLNDNDGSYSSSEAPDIISHTANLETTSAVKLNPATQTWSPLDDTAESTIPSVTTRLTSPMVDKMTSILADGLYSINTDTTILSSSVTESNSGTSTSSSSTDVNIEGATAPPDSAHKTMSRAYDQSLPYSTEISHDINPTSIPALTSASGDAESFSSFDQNHNQSSIFITSTIENAVRLSTDSISHDPMESSSITTKQISSNSMETNALFSTRIDKSTVSDFILTTNSEHLDITTTDRTSKLNDLLKSSSSSVMMQTSIVENINDLLSSTSLKSNTIANHHMSETTESLPSVITNPKTSQSELLTPSSEKISSGNDHTMSHHPGTSPTEISLDEKSTNTMVGNNDLTNSLRFTTSGDESTEQHILSTEQVDKSTSGISTVNNNGRTGDTFIEVSTIKLNTIESSTSIPSHEDQSSFHSSNVMTSATTVPLVATATINEHSDEVMSSSSAVMETIDRTISTSTVTPLITISDNLIQSETTTKTKLMSPSEHTTNETFVTLSHMENSTGIASSSVSHFSTLVNIVSSTSTSSISTVDEQTKGETTSRFPSNHIQNSNNDFPFMTSISDEHNQAQITTRKLLEDSTTLNHDDQATQSTKSEEGESTAQLFKATTKLITTSDTVIVTTSPTQIASRFDSNHYSSSINSIDFNSKSTTDTSIEVSSITSPPRETDHESSPLVDEISTISTP